MDDDVVWDGKSPLTDALERDYAAMRGDGWDLIWTPTSPLTTDWRDIAPWAEPDPNQHVATAISRPTRRGPRRSARRMMTEYAQMAAMSRRSGGRR